MEFGEIINTASSRFGKCVNAVVEYERNRLDDFTLSEGSQQANIIKTTMLVALSVFAVVSIVATCSGSPVAGLVLGAGAGIVAGTAAFQAQITSLDNVKELFFRILGIIRGDEDDCSIYA